MSSVSAGLVGLLRSKGLTLALAESCTGGLVSKMITDVPGSSEAFLGGVVSYSNDMKMTVLGVSGDTLKEHGAVSAQTALGMARGIRGLTTADIGASCTGIAGPGGGSEAKPVGLVFMSVVGGNRSIVDALMFKGDRDGIRASASERLLEMIYGFVGAEDG